MEMAISKEEKKMTSGSKSKQMPRMGTNMANNMKEILAMLMVSGKLLSTRVAMSGWTMTDNTSPKNAMLA